MPWTPIFEEAESCYLGRGDFIKDETKALRLFKRAAKLGALPAHRYIAEMYAKKYSVGYYNCPNHMRHETALLDLYKYGADQGSAYCCWEVGLILLGGEVRRIDSKEFTRGGGYYLHKHANKDDAYKCFRRFHSLVPSGVADGNVLTAIELELICISCTMFVKQLDQWLDKVEAGKISSEAVPSNRDPILQFVVDHPVELRRLLNDGHSTLVPLTWKVHTDS
jgi:hypothetical protein